MSIENLNNPEQIKELRVVELKEHDFGVMASDNYHGFDVYNSEQQKIGLIDLWFDIEKKEIMVYKSELNREYQGLGYGKSMYKAAIDLARESGYKLRSWHDPSESAIRVWESLYREGLVQKIDGVYYANN